VIRTRVIEVKVGSLGKIEETELGWCLMAEVPVEKKPPSHRPMGQPPATPLSVRVNDTPYFVVGHSWELTTRASATLPDKARPDGTRAPPAAGLLPDAVLILLVQRIEVVGGGGIVKASANAMDQVKALVPEPGAKMNGGVGVRMG
jgi:hypothetical protein